MDFDPATATPVDDPAAGAVFDPATAQPVDEPTGSAIADMAKRVVRGAVSGTADVAEAAARVGDRWAAILPDWMKADPTATGEQPLHGVSRVLKQGATAIPVDSKRATELKSALAEGIGSAVPALAAGALNPVAGVLELAAQSGEAERAAALAAGDSEEQAAAKASLARVGGAVMGVIPVGPVRAGAGVAERLATRAVTGGVVNAAQDAGMQTLVDQKIDWGRVKQAGAIGTGLGLVLGVPEALALRKALGTAGSHEGKTLAQAIADISTETGEDATAIQRRINEAVGVKPPPTEAETAVRQSDAEVALGGRAAAEASAANAVRAEQAQAGSLLEARAQRTQDFDEAVEAQNPGYRQWWLDALAEQDQIRQSPQGAAGLAAGLRAEGVTAAQDTRLAQRPNVPADIAAELQGGPAPADPRIVDPTRTDPLGGRMTPPPEIDVGQGGTVRPAWDYPAPQPEIYPGSEISNVRARDSAPNTGLRTLRGQTGAVSPEVLVPIARAAVGGAIGYASGDTPEERVHRALLGMGFGAIASPALARKLASVVINSPVAKPVAELARARMTALRLAVAPQSLLPAEIRTQLRWGEQAAAAVTQGGLSLSRDLERALRGIGNPAAIAAAAGRVKEFLEGRLPAAALPAPLQVPAQKVRDYVDALSDRAVAEGVVSGTMANTFLSNRGTYLRRSYAIFLDPNYQPRPGAVDAAITAVQRANGTSRAEAEGVVAGILDKNSRANLPDFLLGRGKVAGKDVSSLVRRQDLLPEVRVMLGEVQDPILAVNQTIPRMARLIELDATQRQVRAIGQRLGIFSETRRLTHPTPLVSEGSAPHDILAGLYAPTEIAAAFQKQAGTGRTSAVPEFLWRTLTTATTVAKAAKTVFNPESYAPNFISGIIANVGNANFRYDHTVRGLALGAEEMGALRQFLPKGSVRDSLRTELVELQKLGILGQSVNSGDLLRTLESSFFGKLNSTARGVLSVPFKIYGSVDDFNRYIAWQSERARYAKVFPGMATDELKRYAAEIVRATTPNYGEVPKVVKQLSVAGLMPNFVNFTWETFRNTKNTVKIALQDLQRGRATDNAALIRAGAERLAAITAVTAAGSMWGFSKLSRDSHGITDEKDKAVRFFSPKWNKTGVLAYHTRAEAGKPVEYSNLSYLVPHALLFQAIEAGRRGSDEGKTIEEFLGALNEQFGMGNNVVLPGLVGALTGIDVRKGKEIPKTAVEPTIGDRARFLVDDAFKPLVVDQVGKMQKAFAAEKGPYGRVYTVDEQLKRLMGLRAQTLDPVQAVAWKAKELGSGFHDAGDIYRLQLNQNLSPDELQKYYGKADQARRQQFDEMRQMLVHARSLGVNEEQSIAALREARIGPDVILGVLDGRYVPLPKDKAKTAADLMADIRARPAQQRAAALAQLYRDDPQMAKQVIERVKAAAKGTTEREKLLLGLGVSDGERADYLRQKLQDLGNVQARQAFMLELRRKGILTDRVLEQMTKGPTPAVR